jgi:uncharacterized damage-inducible protein DinB
MAPGDLLRPLEGQREETLRLLTGLSEDDLEKVDPEGGWTVRQHLAHIAASELGEVFVIRRAADGDIVHMSKEDRDEFNQSRVEQASQWTVERLKHELEDARNELRRAFDELNEEDLDRSIRWPDWPARTIRTTIPYMLEHEDSHCDLIRKALER